MIASVTPRRFLTVPVDRIAGFLLVPYFCWTAFAAILNAAIWELKI